MKARYAFALAVTVTLLTGVMFLTPVLAYVSPGNPTGYINDFSGVISQMEKSILENKLSIFHASTSNEIAVAVVKNLEGDYIEHYAVKLFEEWGIGKKDKDNGVLLVVALEEKTLRIEVGYGLEGALPDSVASSIIQNVIIPQLREENYDAAVSEGVAAIMAATEGEYVGDGPSFFGSFDFEFVIGIFVLVIVVLQWLSAILARSKSFWAGGVVGGIAGAVAATYLGWWVVFGLGVTSLLAALGLLFDFVVSKAYQKAKQTSSRIPWWGGGGGFGGGSSSGGFGGFGGGSSGGGGASGHW